MDSSDDVTYFNYLNDKSHSFLLHSSDVALGVQDPTLSGGTVFGDLDDGTHAWMISSIPVLLDTPVAPQDHAMELPIGLEPQKGLSEFEEDEEESTIIDIENSEVSLAYPVEVPEGSFITSNGLVLTNDTLWQLSVQSVEHSDTEEPDDESQLIETDITENSNDKIYEVSFEPEETPTSERELDSKIIENSNQIIQLLNIDGTSILNITKELLSNKFQKVPASDSTNVKNTINTDLKTVISTGTKTYKQTNTDEKRVINPDVKKVINTDVKKVIDTDVKKLFSTGVKNIINTNFKNVVKSDVKNVVNTDVKNVANTDMKQVANVDIEKVVNSDVRKEIESNDLVETIVAYKCKKCALILESTDSIWKHIEEKHSSDTCGNDITTTESTEVAIGKSSIIKMKSILNINPITNTTRQLVYLCSECDVGYPTMPELKKHMMVAHNLSNGLHTGNGELNSSDSSKTPELSQNQKYISVVKKQQKASKKLKCCIKGCEARFASEQSLLRHEQCHVNGQKRQFKCPTCESIFSMWRVCSLHMWRCHNIDIGLLSCPICNIYKTSSAHKLIVHMSIHDDIKQYLCNVCGKAFKQMTQLRNHQVLHLKADEIPQWSRKRECNLCENIYADAKSLKKHIQDVHNKLKPYVCNICGHKTARRAMLKLHLRQHTGEKPYQCSVCTYRTGDHNSLRRHVMRHNGDKQYSCPHCDYQSIQAIAFKKHIATKHPGLDGVFSCLHCPFQTVNEGIYAVHCKAHQKSLLKKKDVCDQMAKDLDKSVCSSAEGTVSSDSTEEKKKQISAMEVDDEETQHGFLISVHVDETVDTGGITIPAGSELQPLKD